MRRFAIAIANVFVFAAACGGGNTLPPDPDAAAVVSHDPVHVDLVRRADTVGVFVRDPALPDSCANPFTELGEIATITDYWVCDSAPAEWVVRIELVDPGGTVREEHNWLPPEWPYFGVAEEGSELVFVGEDGDRHAIAVPDAADIALTLDVQPIAEGFSVSWDAPGSSSVLLEVLAGLGGESIHTADPPPRELGPQGEAPNYDLFVTAFTSAELDEGELGEIHVWRASHTVSRDLTTL